MPWVTYNHPSNTERMHNGIRFTTGVPVLVSADWINATGDLDGSVSLARAYDYPGCWSVSSTGPVEVELDAESLKVEKPAKPNAPKKPKAKVAKPIETPKPDPIDPPDPPDPPGE